MNPLLLGSWLRTPDGEGRRVKVFISGLESKGERKRRWPESHNPLGEQDVSILGRPPICPHLLIVLLCSGTLPPWEQVFTTGLEDMKEPIYSIPRAHVWHNGSKTYGSDQHLFWEHSCSGSCSMLHRYCLNIGYILCINEHDWILECIWIAGIWGFESETILRRCLWGARWKLFSYEFVFLSEYKGHSYTGRPKNKHTLTY